MKRKRADGGPAGQIGIRPEPVKGRNHFRMFGPKNCTAGVSGEHYSQNKLYINISYNRDARGLHPKICTFFGIVAAGIDCKKINRLDYSGGVFVRKFGRFRA